MNDVTLIYTYYNYPERMAIEAARWNGYSDFIKNHLKIIVVDDGSKIPAHTLPADYPANVQIYRVTKDVVWNEKGARNLGAVMAKTDWVIFTDFDHYFDKTSLCAIIKKLCIPGIAYRFNRVDVHGNPKSIHSESYLIERIRALQAGGFSECFTGQYGAAPYQIFCERFVNQGGCFNIMDGAEITYRGLPKTAQRNMDMTVKRRHDPNHGILHFQWERTL
jgi:hypothetical protein